MLGTSSDIKSKNVTFKNLLNLDLNWFLRVATFWLLLGKDWQLFCQPFWQHWCLESYLDFQNE